jgi:cell division protein FtsB
MQKKSVVRTIIFSGLSLTLGFYIIFGKRGVKEYLRLKQEIEQEKKMIALVEQEIHHLENKIDRWSDDQFEHEKIAREDLQMGCTNELVYLTPDSGDALLEAAATPAVGASCNNSENSGTTEA